MFFQELISSSLAVAGKKAPGTIVSSKDIEIRRDKDVKC